MHESSFLRMKWFKENYLNIYKGEKLKILDVGSYDVNGSYKLLFDDTCWEYYGLDIEHGPNVDIIVNDHYNWSNILSESFDVVVSGQAFEHIEYFWLTMREIERTLKLNGLCCIIAPSSGPEHKYPTDCYRFYEDGMKALASSVGFEILYASSAKQNDNPDFKDEICVWKDSIIVARKITNNFMLDNTNSLLETIKLQQRIILNYENAACWKLTKPLRLFLDYIKRLFNEDRR